MIIIILLPLLLYLQNSIFLTHFCPGGGSNTPLKAGLLNVNNLKRKKKRRWSSFNGKGNVYSCKPPEKLK